MSKRIAVDSVSTLKRQGVNKQLGQTVKTEGLPPGTSYNPSKRISWRERVQTHEWMEHLQGISIQTTTWPR